MDGNVFRFYDSRFFSNHTDSNKESYYLNTDKYKIDYDVAIDKYSTLSINNLYRYWMGQSFGTMGTTGIKIGKMDIDWNNSSNPETAFAAFDDFNNLSYALSQSSHIGQHFNVRAHFAVKDATTAPLNPVFMKNSGTMWVAESGTYCYYYQRIVDRSHNIATTKAQISQYDSSNNSISSSCNIELEQSREGVLLNLNNQGKTFILSSPVRNTDLPEEDSTPFSTSTTEGTTISQPTRTTCTTSAMCRLTRLQARTASA